MKKLVASLVFMAALAIGASAHAAAVNIILTQDAVGGTSWTLSVNTSVALGGISVLTTGLNSFNLNTALAGISPADSGFSIDPLGTGQNLVFTNNTGNGVVLGGAGATSIVIGSLIGGTTAPPVGIQDATDAAGGSAFDPNLQPITDVSLTTVPKVPEPMSLLLVGIGLASVAVVRRKAA
jgi:hypothetical protein